NPRISLPVVEPGGTGGESGDHVFLDQIGWHMSISSVRLFRVSNRISRSGLPPRKRIDASLRPVTPHRSKRARSLWGMPMPVDQGVADRASTASVRDTRDRSFSPRLRSSWASSRAFEMRHDELRS